jgi:uncharacterized protein
MTKQLFQLQEIDLAIEAEENVLREKRARLGNRNALDAAILKRDEAAESLSRRKRQQHSLETEAEDIAAKIARVEDKLYGGKIGNPKELSSLQEEAAILKKQRDEKETAALETLEQVEAEEARVSALAEELRQTEAAWQREQQQLEAEITDSESKLAGLQTQRAEAAADIDAATLRYYETLRKQKGQAVARVAQGICHACRISLSSAETQRVRGSAIVNCSSCGRILYLP